MSDIDFSLHMYAVATALLGKPNPHHSKGSDLRFGTKGSLSVDVKNGIFYSHEHKQGGGVLDLIRHVKGEAIDPVEWMRCEGFLSRRAATNGSHKSAAEVEPETKRETEVTFDYTDESGQLLFQVVRFVFRKPDGLLALTPQGKPKKTFRQRRRDPKTNVWIWDVEGVRLVPYRLPDLIKAVAAPKTIFIVEGERKVDALREAGLQATCNAMGAGKWQPELVPYFKGASVVILPDNDTTGQGHAQLVASSLRQTAKSIKVLTLPGVLEKGDIIDWFALGHDVKELRELVTKAPTWEPPTEQAGTAPESSTGDGQKTWQEPKPLPNSLLPVKAFDLDLLPATIAPWVADIAERMQCPLDFVAVPALVALGAVIGRRVGVRPQRRTDWIEVPNLWACIVGRPGMLKSPAMNEALKPCSAWRRTHENQTTRPANNMGQLLKLTN
jgi:hypothetical protein